MWGEEKVYMPVPASAPSLKPVGGDANDVSLGLSSETQWIFTETWMGSPGRWREQGYQDEDSPGQHERGEGKAKGIQEMEGTWQSWVLDASERASQGRTCPELRAVVMSRA